MRAYLYEIKNNINDKIYIGATTRIAFRLGEHIYRLFKNNHEIKELQEDFNANGISSFSFSFSLTTLEKAKIDEVEKIKMSSNLYNQRGLTYNNEIFITSDYSLTEGDCIKIWGMLNKYLCATYLQEYFNLSSRREVYKIWYFVQFVLDPRYVDLSEFNTDFEKRSTSLLDWEPILAEEEERFVVLSLLEFLPLVGGTLEYLMGKSSGRYYTAIRAESARWSEEKKKYYQKSEKERFDFFIKVAKESGILEKWLELNHANWNLKEYIRYYLLKEVFYSVTGEEKYKAFSFNGATENLYKRNNKKVLYNTLIPIIKHPHFNYLIKSEFFFLIENLEQCKIQYEMLQYHLSNPTVSHSEFARQFNTNGHKIKRFLENKKALQDTYALTHPIQ